MRISQTDFALKDYDQTSFLFKYEAKLSPMCLSCLTISDLLIVYGDVLCFITINCVRVKKELPYIYCSCQCG